MLKSVMTEADRAIDLILRLEGGYINHSDDPGGETRWGISKRSYPDLDIANLTREQAASIYKTGYWTPIAKRVKEPKLRLLAFDAAVNHGLSRALKWLETYNTFDSFLANRIRFYTDLSTFPTFGKGWMRRVSKVVEMASRWYENTDFHKADLLVDNRSWLDRVFSGRTWGPVAFRVRPLSSGKGSKIDVRRSD